MTRPNEIRDKNDNTIKNREIILKHFTNDYLEKLMGISLMETAIEGSDNFIKKNRVTLPKFYKIKEFKVNQKIIRSIAFTGLTSLL